MSKIQHASIDLNLQECLQQGQLFIEFDPAVPFDEKTEYRLFMPYPEEIRLYESSVDAEHNMVHVDADDLMYDEEYSLDRVWGMYEQRPARLDRRFDVAKPTCHKGFVSFVDDMRSCGYDLF